MSVRLGSRVPWAVLTLTLLALPLEGRAQDIPTPEEERAKRLGFYFGMSLESMSQRGHANGIGVLIDDPGVLEEFPIRGPQLDGDFGSRNNLGFFVGFRLRNNVGNIEARFFQWDEQQDLRTEAPPGKAIANTLTSPEAGFHEDQGNPFIPGRLDGQVAGYESGPLSEGGSDPQDNVLDGAEDVNFNRQADFIRFLTSDAIVGTIQNDFQVFDLDFRRRMKKLRRFELDWRAGLRFASLDQQTDLAYREFGSFAVYIDEEGELGRPEFPSNMPVQDGDGDGETSTTANEPDGDGFMNGNGDSTMADQIEQVQTVSEDRIIADIDTSGVGIKLGFDGRFELSRKWRLVGGMSVSLLSTESEYRYRETFTSERDRYLNFFNWDFNGDGQFDNFDLDFNGDCAGLPLDRCRPSDADSDALVAQGGFVETDQRLGAENSVRSNPRGVNSNAYSGANAGRIRVGDPVPESERNRDTITETTLLRDVGGDRSGIEPMVDLHLAAEYQFSKFASISFGLRASRWFNAGNFRSIADDVVVGNSGSVSGDYSADGYYLMLTVVPR